MHVPVLATSAIQWLDVRGGGTYVDCTAGAGGHAVLIAQGAGPRGHLIAIDRDAAAVRAASERLKPFPFAQVIHGNYSELDGILAQAGVTEVDGVLIDAGMSSMQLDDAERGFSFQAEGPLDMRMDTSKGATAAQFLATISESDLAEMLHRQGEVRGAHRIAKSICERRDQGQLATTGDLVAAILGTDELHGRAVHGRRADVVRQVFQAIRVSLNQEMENLERGLRAAVKVLAKGGRLVLITFQSGEDRVWKSVMNDVAKEREERTPDGRTLRIVGPVMRVLTKRPALPTKQEIEANPRAHSARLRAAEKI